MADHPLILVFDSGFGGLTVYREIAASRPDASYVYCADNAAFPYGNLSEQDIIARVLSVAERLIGEYQPDLFVIACNTASTVALPHLRSRFSIPFIGTVPAIKPAAMASKSRMISVLATPATVARDYTADLITSFADGCEVTLVGSRMMATIAEAKLHGAAISDADILAEIAPAFIEHNGKRTDQIVLACTHYPLLLEELHALAPWPVSFVDPAPAIARRVVALLGQNPGDPENHDRVIAFTGVLPASEDEHKMLENYGFNSIVSLNKPLYG